MYPRGTRRRKHGQLSAVFHSFGEFFRFLSRNDIGGKSGIDDKIRADFFKGCHDFSHCVFAARQTEFFTQSHSHGRSYLHDNARRFFIPPQNFPSLVRFVFNGHGSRRANGLPFFAVDNYVTHLPILLVFPTESQYFYRFRFFANTILTLLYHSFRSFSIVRKKIFWIFLTFSPHKFSKR